MNKKDIPKHKTPEILAPAGDLDALTGAIKGGADAVYLGITDFNARWGATNFALNELENAIDLAHSHDIKVYLALNIPIKQKEMQDALEIVDRAYSYGIDAIILQDLGLLTLLRKIYPDLKLHASTQMTVHNKAGVDFVEHAGANRVIVSRELDLSQIKDIVENTNIDIEVFVHGALCYSYSGRCLFSSFLNGRSANRGACTQPCRLHYTLMADGRRVDDSIIGNYPISCAELCTLSGVAEIVNTGVSSLKIEGRMKKTEYVTKSASAYKEAIKRIEEKDDTEDGEALDSDWIKAQEIELAKMFYRGFTKGFLLNEIDVVHQKYSSNYGVFLGEVKKIAHFKHTTDITLCLQTDINAKDGVGIFTKKRMLGSKVTGIITQSGERVLSAKKGGTVALEISQKTGRVIKPKDEVYLTTDTQLIKTLQEAPLKTCPVQIKITATKGSNLSVEMIGGKDGVRYTDDYIIQPAKKSPTTKEQIKEIMERLGDTPYLAECIEIEADDEIFIPLSVLTNARRETSTMLLQKTIREYKKEGKNPKLSECIKNIDCMKRTGATEGLEISEVSEVSERPEIKTNPERPEPLLSVEIRDLKSLYSAARAGADIIYIPISEFDELIDPQNEQGLLSLKDNGTEVVLIIPQITHDSELLALHPLLEKVHNAGFSVACSNLGAVELAKTSGTPFVVQKELNTFNMFTAITFYDAGSHRVTLSSELNLDEITEICHGLACCKNGIRRQIEIVIHGRELLLVTENDLLKPLYDKRAVNDDSEMCLIDRDDFSYPVKRWGTRTLIYNSGVLYMLDEIRHLKKCGADIVRLDLSLNDVKEVREITRAYKRALSGDGVKLNSKLGEIYTKGHYFKGV